ncbi:MAG: type II toxin-antitoxin system HicB family antitoxin [Phycisphaeraceae bacterium]
MSATMKYKGYVGTVELDTDHNLLHGVVCGIKDVIHYEADNAADLQQAFRDSVDDYLAFCAERDEEPDKAYSGVLNVRFGADLHRRMAVISKALDASINELVVQAVEDRFAEDFEGLFEHQRIATPEQAKRLQKLKKKSSRQKTAPTVGKQNQTKR